MASVKHNFLVKAEKGMFQGEVEKKIRTVEKDKNIRRSLPGEEANIMLQSHAVQRRNIIERKRVTMQKRRGLDAQHAQTKGNDIEAKHKQRTGTPYEKCRTCLFRNQNFDTSSIFPS